MDGEYNVMKEKEPTFMELVEEFVFNAQLEEEMKALGEEWDRRAAQFDEDLRNGKVEPLDEESKAGVKRITQQTSKYFKGYDFLSDVFEELQATLPEEHRKELPSLEEAMAKVYSKEHNHQPGEKFVLSYDTAPKIEFFNSVAQYYTDAGMRDKAEQTQAKCEEWKLKFSFDPEPK